MLLGLCKNTTKDALNTLEERGIVTMHDNCLTIDDKERLQITKTVYSYYHIHFML